MIAGFIACDHCLAQQRLAYATFGFIVFWIAVCLFIFWVLWINPKQEGSNIE